MRWNFIFAVLWNLCFFSFSATAQELCIESLHGEARSSYLRKISGFYNSYYRESPYFYDCSGEDWDRYIRSCTDEIESIVCLAVQEEDVIGVIVGTPLAKTSQKYKAAFMTRSIDLDSLFFLGELAIDPAYERYGVRQKLYEEFEHQVAKKQRFAEICTWLPKSGEDRLSEGFLGKVMGFVQSDICFEELWKDTFGNEKVPHFMICWQKRLLEASEN